MARLADYIDELSPRCRAAFDMFELTMYTEDKRLIDPINNPNRTSKNNKLYDPKVFNNDCNDIFMLSCSCVNEIMNSL